MRGKNIIFNDKSINKSSFYKNKKLFKIDDIDVDKILVSKKESYDTKTHLNTPLDIMMMVSLDHLYKASSMSLTLKRLRAGGQFDSPCGFSENVSSKG